jgi:hypothetical protein
MLSEICPTAANDSADCAKGFLCPHRSDGAVIELLVSAAKHRYEHNKEGDSVLLTMAAQRLARLLNRPIPLKPGFVW